MALIAYSKREVVTSPKGSPLSVTQTALFRHTTVCKSRLLPLRSLRCRCFHGARHPFRCDSHCNKGTTCFLSLLRRNLEENIRPSALHTVSKHSHRLNIHCNLCKIIDQGSFKIDAILSNFFSFSLSMCSVPELLSIRYAKNNLSCEESCGETFHSRSADCISACFNPTVNIIRKIPVCAHDDV